MEKFKRLFFLLIIFSLTLPSFGQYNITAKMDSVNLLMGKTTPIYVQVVTPEEVKGYLKGFENGKSGKDYISICGDSVELKRNYTVDTTYIGSGKMQLDYRIELQAYDSGTFRLPPFIFIANNDSSISNHLTFNVIPVNVTADDAIDGFTGVEAPEGSRFYDFIPDWILDFWWIFILIIIALIASYWAIARYKQVGTILPVARVLSPYEIALKDLETLKSRNLWERGLEKEYFTELTDILRTYLMNRFGINALEMTTSQILEKVKQSEFSDKKSYVDDILKMADFVKFAKVRPLAEDNITAFENAVKFIEETGNISNDGEDEGEEDEKKSINKESSVSDKNDMIK